MITTLLLFNIENVSLAHAIGRECGENKKKLILFTLS